MADMIYDHDVLLSDPPAFSFNVTYPGFGCGLDIDNKSFLEVIGRECKGKCCLDTLNGTAVYYLKS